MSIDVDAIRARITVSDVLAHLGYAVPKQDGVMLCPFHQEKTPSFRVHQDYFYCFGCSTYGDIFTLIARLHDCDFTTAATHLAHLAGLTDAPILHNDVAEARARQRDAETAKHDAWTKEIGDVVCALGDLVRVENACVRRWIAGDPQAMDLLAETYRQRDGLLAHEAALLADVPERDRHETGEG